MIPGNAMRRDLFISVFLFTALSLVALQAVAQQNPIDEPVGQNPYALTASVASATAVTADRGSFVAGAFQFEYIFSSVPLYLTSRLLFGDAITGNDNWRFDHYHQTLEVGLGVQKQLGRGTLFGQITAGGLGVYEVASHHQIVRLGDELGRFTNWSLGPSASAEMGLQLKLGAGFSSRLSLGPTWTQQTVANRSTDIFGVQTNLGLRYAF